MQFFFPISGPDTHASNRSDHALRACRRRQPECTVLCRLVQAYLATWLALHNDEQGCSTPSLPSVNSAGILSESRLLSFFFEFRIPYTAKFP